MNNRLKVKGQLKAYIKWPMMLSVLLIAMDAGMFAIKFQAGIIMAIFTLVYIVIATLIYYYNKPLIVNDLVDFATRYGQVQRQLLKEFVIPYALLDETGRFVWQNEAFEEVFHKEKIFRKSITSIVSEITKEKLPTNEDPVDITFSFEKRNYRANMKRIPLSEMIEKSSIVDGDDFNGCLIAVFLFDETEINLFIKEKREQSLVNGLIYLDNYDEALESVEDVRRSLLTALIDRKINKYFTAMDAIVRKIEKDKYFVVMKRKSFVNLVENKFDILEDVKTVNIGNEMSLTLSIGFGLDTPSFTQDATYARNAIDLALGRGGDQAVVKSPDRITYYGGKSQQIEKSTRVKARVKAHALKEIIESKDQIVVMGHTISDVDTFGAAIGIYRAASLFGKKCHIVINEVTTAIRPMIEGFIDNPDYEPDLFVTNNEAIQIVDHNTALVVVDTNRPGFTECPELLTMCKSIVVLDHHRQGIEKIENATLSYIEPYASSACEMVAEILQYISDNIKIRNLESDCLFAGIMIDTNNFMAKTGVRTFEAAAFLRRNGADVTRVRKLFRNDIVNYKARAEAVRNAELFKDAYAISVCPVEHVESPTVVGAQAANELLNINSVKASFILTNYQGKVYISARSIDEVNVQVIMEKFGGGGHLNIAGAQIENHTVEEAVVMLKDVIEKMLNEGDL
ncbi:MAG: DHH family phosphoesterase [Lachnospiraceae bacterium]|nr:DHH family phosphoesterase [Lachnospiraceae bacterium]